MKILYITIQHRVNNVREEKLETENDAGNARIRKISVITWGSS